MKESLDRCFLNDDLPVIYQPGCQTVFNMCLPPVEWWGRREEGGLTDWGRHLHISPPPSVWRRSLYRAHIRPLEPHILYYIVNTRRQLKLIRTQFPHGFLSQPGGMIWRFWFWIPITLREEVVNCNFRNWINWELLNGELLKPWMILLTF